MSVPNEEMRQKLALALANGAGQDLLQKIPVTRMTGPVADAFRKSLYEKTPLPDMQKIGADAPVIQGPNRMIDANSYAMMQRMLNGDQVYNDPLSIEQADKLLIKKPAKISSNQSLKDMMK